MEQLPDDIVSLWERYLSGTASLEEVEKLYKLLEDPSLEEDLYNYARNAEMKLAQTDSPPVEIPAAMLQRILNMRLPDDLVQDEHHVPNAQRVRHLRAIRHWGWAAAIILIVAGFTAYQLTLDKQTGEEPVTTAPMISPVIVPGGNKAMLTLSDGTTILLDSAANGTLAIQGNSAIRKLANGQILYESQGKATGSIPMNTMSTPRGGQYQLTLPDGTRVWLNAASSITYPAVFAGKDRRVNITGEAYFEVAKDLDHPFIVASEHTAVHVLGTKFNVSAYDDDQSTRTTLSEGAVEILLNNSSAGKHTAVNLTPGMQAVTRAEADRITVREANVEAELAWLQDMFIFDSESLGSILRKLSRWYDVRVVYDKQVEKEFHFTGRIKRHENLPAVLELLELTGKVRFNIQDRDLRVSMN